MKLIKPVIAVLAALMLLVTPVLAVETPEKAVGEETMLMVWVDLEQIDADMIDEFGDSLKDLVDNPLFGEAEAGLPIGDVEEMIDGLTTLRGGFVQAGGEGLMLLLGMPEDDESWSPPVSVLAKTKGEVDAKAMAALVRTMSEGEMDATVVPLEEEGWHDLSIVNTVDGEKVTVELPEPDKKAFKAFREQFKEVKDPVVSVAFRMQDSMREELKGLADLGAQGAGDAPPEAAMMMGMLQPLLALDTVGLALTIDDDEMEVDVQMIFEDAQNAQMFMNMYNSIMMLAPAMMAQQFQA